MTKLRLTGGGRFDPTEEFVYFAVGISPETALDHPWSLLPVNDLSREFGPDAQVDQLLAREEHKLLLDSGVYWLSTQHAKKHGLSMADALSVSPESMDDFEWLYARYVDLCRRYGDRLWGYIEIDQGGADNKRRIRAKLERAGLRPIPVYHPLNDGWEYFDELAKRYDRIAVGNTVEASAKVRVRILATLWERKRRKYPNLWIHVLGLTPNESLNAYPINSADSSSWMYAVRYGAPSAPGPFAQLKSFGRFDHAFSYDSDVDADHARGHDGSMKFQLAQASYRQRVWRAIARDTNELLDTRSWPKALPGEMVPTPGKVESA